MTNFHAPHTDPNLIINALRFLLDAWKEYRSRTGQKEPDKKEEVLKETVEQAEEMSAQGADAGKIVSQIETKLELGLGTAVKDEIIGRASSILALVQPFQVEAFEYYKNILLVLNKAQEFCKSANIFKLRGATVGNVEHLELPQLGLILPTICGEFKVLASHRMVRGNAFNVRLLAVRAHLSTGAEALQVVLRLELSKAYTTGGSYSEQQVITFTLSKGSEVNRIAFDFERSGPFGYLGGADFRLTSKDFQAIVSAILDDLNNYASELAEEQRDFKETIAPALEPDYLFPRSIMKLIASSNLEYKELNRTTGRTSGIE